MAKPLSFPSLYDEVKQFSVSDLKKWGYLEPGQLREGFITWRWTSDRSISGQISFSVNTLSPTPFIELNYTHNKEPLRYRVNLVSASSNLGKGVVWYFVCPHTLKRCRKLYAVGKYFLHREAFKGCMYESQTYSKRYRELDKTMGAYLRRDWYYPELYKKYSKKMYAGKPTKRYVRLMRLIEKGSY